MRFISVIFLLAASASVKAIYCPSFFQNQTACSCEEYLDGAIVKCSGKEGPLAVEQLKNNKVEVRELWLENAKIIQVRLISEYRSKGRMILDWSRCFQTSQIEETCS